MLARTLDSGSNGFIGPYVDSGSNRITSVRDEGRVSWREIEGRPVHATCVTRDRFGAPTASCSRFFTHTKPATVPASVLLAVTVG